MVSLEEKERRLAELRQQLAAVEGEVHHFLDELKTEVVRPVFRLSNDFLKVLTDGKGSVEDVREFRNNILFYLDKLNDFLDEPKKNSDVEILELPSGKKIETPKIREAKATQEEVSACGRASGDICREFWDKFYDSVLVDTDYTIKELCGLVGCKYNILYNKLKLLNVKTRRVNDENDRVKFVLSGLDIRQSIDFIIRGKDCPPPPEDSPSHPNLSISVLESGRYYSLSELALSTGIPYSRFAKALAGVKKYPTGYLGSDVKAVFGG